MLGICRQNTISLDWIISLGSPQIGGVGNIWSKCNLLGLDHFIGQPSDGRCWEYVGKIKFSWTGSFHRAALR